MKRWIVLSLAGVAMLGLAMQLPGCAAGRGGAPVLAHACPVADYSPGVPQFVCPYGAHGS